MARPGSAKYRKGSTKKSMTQSSANLLSQLQQEAAEEAITISLDPRAAKKKK